MRGAKRSAKNTAKNISLLVLCGLMGVLCAVNWLMGLNIAQMPADSALRRLHDRFVGGAVGYEIRSSGVSAADPAQLALTVDGKLYGVQYNLTDIDAGITATRSLWSQALTGEGLRQADESELCTALRSGSCALLRYHGAIPMQSIAGWLGGSWKDNARLQVETLVYAAGVQRLFVRMADGRLYAADAAVFLQPGFIFQCQKQGQDTQGKRNVAQITDEDSSKGKIKERNQQGSEQQEQISQPLGKLFLFNRRV